MVLHSTLGLAGDKHKQGHRKCHHFLEVNPKHILLQYILFVDIVFSDAMLQYCKSHPYPSTTALKPTMQDPATERSNHCLYCVQCLSNPFLLGSVASPLDCNSHNETYSQCS